MPDRDPGLTPAERTKLLGILGLLGSTFAGERDAAALAASRLLHAKRLGWDEVIVRQDVQPHCRPDRPRPPRPDSAATWLQDLALCQRHAGWLNDWEAAFVPSLAGLRRQPTAGQIEKLAQIAGKLRAKGLA